MDTPPSLPLLLNCTRIGTRHFAFFAPFVVGPLVAAAGRGTFLRVVCGSRIMVFNAIPFDFVLLLSLFSRLSWFHLLVSEYPHVINRPR